MSFIKKLFNGSIFDEKEREQQSNLNVELMNQNKLEKLQKQEFEKNLLSLEIIKYLATVNPEFILEPMVHKALVQALIGRCRGGSVEITLPDDVFPVFNEFIKDEFFVFVLMLEEKGHNFKYEEREFVDLFVKEYSDLNYQILNERYQSNLKGSKNEEEVIFKLIDKVGFEMIYDTKYLNYLSVYLFENKYILHKLDIGEMINKVNEVKARYKVSKLEKRISSIGSPEEYVNIGIESVDNLSGNEFEIFISDLLERIGYACKLTVNSGDQGVDILATNNGILYAIQTKRYESTVGNSAIQEVVSGMHYYNADKSIVITNNYFTSSAKALAQKTGTFLWDRDRLIEMINLHY